MKNSTIYKYSRKINLEAIRFWKFEKITIAKKDIENQLEEIFMKCIQRAYKENKDMVITIIAKVWPQG